MFNLTWPVSYEAVPHCALGDDATEEQITRRALVEKMAIQFLWNWTGRRMGLTEVTHILERDSCGCITPTATFWGRGPYPHFPSRIGPMSTVLPWQSCGCRSNEFALHAPVQEVIEVTLDGVPVTGDYWIENRRWLTRKEAWPSGTEVTYIYGIPVPEGGQIAAGILACEFEKAANNDRTCSLPQRIQTITRQGISVGVLDNFEDLHMGRTGIWLVDSWVASIIHPPRNSIVRSPDYSVKQRRRVVTWSQP